MNYLKTFLVKRVGVVSISEHSGRERERGR